MSSLALLLACSVVSAPAIADDSSLWKVAEQLSKIAKELQPAATFAQDNGNVTLSYKTRPFMVHAASKTGEFAEKAREVVGPGYELFPDPDVNKPQMQRQSHRVIVRRIWLDSEGHPRADIEIRSDRKLILSPREGLPTAQRYTTHYMSVRAGQSIWHDQRAFPALSVVPSQRIEGAGNLTGWVEVAGKPDTKPRRQLTEEVTG